MNIRKNNYLVENVIKNSVKFDGAKIQIGRISPFWPTRNVKTKNEIKPIGIKL